MNHQTKPGGARTAPLPTRQIEEIAAARPARRRALLLLYHRDGVAVAPLAAGRPVVIGRSAPADVVIADECLSRSHARFTLADDGESVAVEDLRSLNGTKIGGERVERATMKPGDQALLGTITAALHVLAGDDAPPLGLEGHDAFLAAVEGEITRARHFHRPFAVLVVRPPAGEREGLPRWCPRVRQLLRPVDRIGFYGAGVVEILLPEATPEEALRLGRSIVARAEGEPPLACGVATFPEAGASAGTLLSAAREAARSGPAGEPLRVAASALTTVLDASRPEGGDAPVLESPAMRELAQTAGRVARASIAVLLRGETGSGKEVVAQLIHGSGPRRGKPLVCVNCAAIPSQLVESTLFGHVKGSFTGAISDRKGVFEEADGGTLLLDEIGELPAAAQAALLRVLETKRVSRVGSTREIAVNVRVIAATHRDLEAMSQAGAFRQDLLFRLNAIEIPIPPLRERREDIAPLAARFLAREAQAAGRGPMSIDPQAMALLERHAWPGNVRELRNTVERAVVIADGDVITPRDLPERIRAAAAAPEPPAAPAPEPSSAPAPEPPPGPPARDASLPVAHLYTGTLDERKRAFERDVLTAALRQTGGHQTEAARLLDVPLRTLQAKIKTHGLKKHYSAGDDA